ncbi:MAG: hypothetical protein DSZ32_07015 [Gammaproteobacteria bacterium]|nr:MAG: hypothetical protein DSZ32_07015 [Gammaproteobacteria bacterium]
MLKERSNILLYLILATIAGYSLGGAGQVLASTPLVVNAHPGIRIHDSSYKPPPDGWPSWLPWNGEGKNKGPSYRYGPALIRHGGNQLHFWACSQGDPDINIADYIRYKHSSNGGVSWGAENIALAPTPGSLDSWAVCDPSVIKIGGWYYMAYTGTKNSTAGGFTNHVFVARSTRPDSGYQKWNGSGWGGTPSPAVRYTGSADNWGFGEPSMVVKDGVIYFYFTVDEGTPRTRVATAPANNPNWPGALVHHGYAISERDWAEDQTDVKYLPQVGRFIGVGIANRFTSSSYLHVWESLDGLHFYPVDTVAANLQPTAHNAGLSGDASGHAEMGNREYVSYSYTGPGGDWGRWDAFLNRISIGGPPYAPLNIPVKNDITPILQLLLM